MTMTLVKLSYNSKLVPDPGLVLQTPLCRGSSHFVISQFMMLANSWLFQAKISSIPRKFVVLIQTIAKKKKILEKFSIFKIFSEIFQKFFLFFFFSFFLSYFFVVRIKVMNLQIFLLWLLKVEKENMNYRLQLYFEFQNNNNNNVLLLSKAL